MNQVFIVGAGYVGSQAALELQSRGYSVHVGKRNPTADLPAGFSDKVQVHGMDVHVPDSYPQALCLAQTLVYCLAATGFTEQQYRHAYLEGLLCLLSHAPRLAAKKVIFVSSTGVFSQNDGSTVDENSLTQPKGFSGQIMLEAEQALHAFGHSHPSIQTSCIRFSGIYGPTRTRVIQEVRKGTPVSPQRWQQYTNRIHRDDCARAIAHLVAQTSLRKCYVASDQCPSTYGEVVTWLAGFLKVPVPLMQEAPDAGPPERGGHKRCWSTGLLEEGFSFTYPSFREGYAALA